MKTWCAICGRSKKRNTLRKEWGIPEKDILIRAIERRAVLQCWSGYYMVVVGWTIWTRCFLPIMCMSWREQGKLQISKPALLYSAQCFSLTTWYRTILKQEEGAEQRKNIPITLGKYILCTNISLECWALPTVEQKSKMASWRGIIAQQWGAWQ